jgi:hypothetical protein
VWRSLSPERVDGVGADPDLLIFLAWVSTTNKGKHRIAPWVLDISTVVTPQQVRVIIAGEWHGMPRGAGCCVKHPHTGLMEDGLLFVFLAPSLLGVFLRIDLVVFAISDHHPVWFFLLSC